MKERRRTTRMTRPPRIKTTAPSATTTKATTTTKAKATPTNRTDGHTESTEREAPALGLLRLGTASYLTRSVGARGGALRASRRTTTSAGGVAGRTHRGNHVGCSARW